MDPLAEALQAVSRTVQTCSECGNVDTSDPCAICRDEKRDASLICVLEEVGDLWALGRTGSFKGRYHVLGGTLSALDQVGPEELRIPQLVNPVDAEGISEIILALNATVDGQTTAHYIADQLEDMGVKITSLAQGVPVGGELDYLDDGTIGAALRARKTL